MARGRPAVSTAAAQDAKTDGEFSTENPVSGYVLNLSTGSSPEPPLGARNFLQLMAKRYDRTWANRAFSCAEDADAGPRATATKLQPCCRSPYNPKPD